MLRNFFYEVVIVTIKDKKDNIKGAIPVTITFMHYMKKLKVV